MTNAEVHDTNDGDTISRQLAIELVDWYQHEFCECDYAFGELANELSKLPSAEPRKGKWIPKPIWQGAEAHFYACSLCDYRSWTQDNYCSVCGASMVRGEEDGENN